MVSSSDVHCAFASIGTCTELAENIAASLERYVCQLYEPGTGESSVTSLRWHMFSKKQAEGQKLPPTSAALRQAILHAHYQAIIWNQDATPCPNIPAQEGFGWTEESDQNCLVPIPTLLPPAPQAIIQLVKCGCKRSKCANTCTCRMNNLNCTELCGCGGEEDTCTNSLFQRLNGLDDVDTVDSELV